MNAGKDGDTDAHLNQKLHVAIAVEYAAAPGASAQVLEAGSLRRCNGGEPDVRFDSIAQDHDGAYLPGRLPLSIFGVNGKNCGARINAPC